MLGIAPESPASGARFVRRFFVVQDALPEPSIKEMDFVLYCATMLTLL